MELGTIAENQSAGCWAGGHLPDTRQTIFHRQIEFDDLSPFQQSLT